MSPTRFLRPPLVWLVLIEAGLLAAIALIGWHAWQARLAAPQVVVAPAAPRSRAGLPSGLGARRSPSPAPPVALPQVPAAGPTPSMRTDSQFLSQQARELNRTESSFEDLQWRMTSSLVNAIRYYLDHVVLPAVQRSEQSR